MEEGNKRYVAHFDMLGFKSAILRNVDESWGALSDLQGITHKIQMSEIGVKGSNRRFSNRIRSVIFSDSVLVFTLQDEVEDLLSILILTCQLFGDSLARCLPLRGGISYGDFYYNSDLNLYCGQPFVNAYIIGESAHWSGVVIDDLVAHHFHSNYHRLTSDPSTRDLVVRWNVPYKNGTDKECWVINWPLVFRDNLRMELPISPEQYYQAFESLFGPYQDLADTVKEKYQNTVFFLNESLKER